MIYNENNSSSKEHKMATITTPAEANSQAQAELINIINKLIDRGKYKKEFKLPLYIFNAYLDMAANALTNRGYVVDTDPEPSANYYLVTWT